MKKFKFPTLKKEELQKIRGGTTYIDGVPWGGGFYNDNDESGNSSPRTCYRWICGANGPIFTTQISCGAHNNSPRHCL